MEEIRDCKNRLACKGDAATGFVELVYKGQRIMTVLSVGAEITIEREGVVTVIQRITDSSFHIDSYIGAA